MDAQLQAQMQPEASGRPDASATLWSSSTAWRTLVISSCLLTSLAISALLVLPVLNASCKLSVANAAPTHVAVRVTGFVTQDEVPSIRRRVEARVGGKESPKYLSQRRVLTIGLHSSFTTSAVIPDGMMVKVGDVAELNSRYRDPALPCNYIPWTIDRILQGR